MQGEVASGGKGQGDVGATTLDLWRGDSLPSKKVNIFRSVPIGGLKFLAGVRMAFKPPHPGRYR